MSPSRMVLLAALLLGLPGLVAAQESQADRNKALVTRFGTAVDAKDFAAVRELIAPDFVRHCQATPGLVVSNREQFIQFLKADALSVPDSKQTPRYLIAEGDLVAFWISYEGTQTGQMGPFPPSGKRMQLDAAGLFRVHNNQLAELWITWDNLTALTQLGHLQLPPTGQH